jgi:hypothetical protein
MDNDSGAHAVHGEVITFMWDYGVSIPLWDEEGLLPDEPEWLRSALGLSDDLIGALGRWGRGMNDLDDTSAEEHSTSESQATRRRLEEQAKHLVERLRREVGSRYTIVHRP